MTENPGTDGRPIGIFDSGVGGLTVAAAIQQALPGERLLYFGDNAHVPYGPRPVDEIVRFSRAITKALLQAGAKLVVIACNTASGAALKVLREEFPEVDLVGMEPAVKPAVEHTRTKVVGVIATTYTVQGEVFNAVVERFAHDVEVITQDCPGLVGQIEAGAFDTPQTLAMLHGWLDPMVARGIDTLVLGCTHYPIIRPVIERIVGPAVRVIEPSAAIARRVEHILTERQRLVTPGAKGGMVCHTSGDPASFANMLRHMGLTVDGPVRQAHWRDGELVLG